LSHFSISFFISFALFISEKNEILDWDFSQFIKESVGNLQLFANFFMIYEFFLIFFYKIIGGLSKIFG